MKRTEYCGRINKDNIDEQVVLKGWVHRRRDLGNLIFIQLRDREGIIQLVFDPEKCSKEVMECAKLLRSEFVIEVLGKVIARTIENINPEMSTGEFEVLAENLEILNSSELIPFHIDDNVNVSENLRLKYRYLDLRRDFMKDTIWFRYKVLDCIRKFMGEKEFIEIETPFLIKSTPEGARDFVVPSRMHTGKFYALPQSPQLFKQLLMVAAFDKYFQIARCFRDEDARADRQTDFTQLDIEMSFVSQDEIFTLMEDLFKKVFKETMNIDIKTPFDRIDYDISMDKYGSDKPERRYNMFLNDITSLFEKSEFKVFKENIENGGVIKAIVLKGKSTDISRKKVGEYEEFVKKFKAKGLAFVKYENNSFSGGIAKFVEPIKQKFIEMLNLEDKDIVFFGSDSKKIVNNVLGNLRLKLIKEFDLIEDKSVFDFCWVTRFPLFEKDDNGNWIAMHHLFSMPTHDTVEFVDTDPGKVYGQLYDLVINGNEAASGSIRIHNAKLQKKIIGITGMSEKEMEQKFGFLLEAFKYGAPPHGGIAPGIDRLIMIMKGLDNIKDVIAFPKTNNQLCLLTGAPDFLSIEQLNEIGIKMEEKNNGQE
ncbi:MAG: aspartate--tRNA ligase [Candidatus Muirbacterium halophilum]|nr:aspartate--tRNA ligase [Candidatus Muirbacterium halophilum]MCK9475284.1 aspartate--tRNA ligase [Candidatus Muirbacterium halophilum]